MNGAARSWGQLRAERKGEGERLVAEWLFEQPPLSCDQRRGGCTGGGALPSHVAPLPAQRGPSRPLLSSGVGQGLHCRGLGALEQTRPGSGHSRGMAPPSCLPAHPSCQLHLTSRSRRAGRSWLVSQTGALECCPLRHCCCRSPVPRHRLVCAVDQKWRTAAPRRGLWVLGGGGVLHGDAPWGDVACTRMVGAGAGAGARQAEPRGVPGRLPHFRGLAPISPGVLRAASLHLPGDAQEPFLGCAPLLALLLRLAWWLGLALFPLPLLEPEAPPRWS